MFAGHFGVATAVKAKTPGTPLWALLVSTQFLDIVFSFLFYFRIESIERVADGYGGLLIHAHYSHSLVGAVAISLIAGFIAMKLWGKRSGIVISAVTFSHWLLDLLVHRPDLAILPGNVGELPLLGLSLWTLPLLSFLVELVLITVGILFYTRFKVSTSSHKQKAYLISGVVALIILPALLQDVLL